LIITTKKAVFLDRDGVVNRSTLLDGFPHPPASIEEVTILEGVTDAIQLLKNNGFVPVVVTNQPDVARGLKLEVEVDEINSYIGRITGIDYFYTCFHDDCDSCDCRKPLPGLIFQAASELNLDVTQSFMVGDRWRDIAAGQAAGCATFFIDYSYPEKLPTEPFTKVLSLLDATKMIVGR
jgi:D-glycero-D-manno-heptose 1,7-bisphosphate phosphatase